MELTVPPGQRTASRVEYWDPGPRTALWLCLTRPSCVHSHSAGLRWACPHTCSWAWCPSPSGHSAPGCTSAASPAWQHLWVPPSAWPCAPARAQQSAGTPSPVLCPRHPPREAVLPCRAGDGGPRLPALRSPPVFSLLVPLRLLLPLISACLSSWFLAWAQPLQLLVQPLSGRPENMRAAQVQPREGPRGPCFVAKPRKPLAYPPPTEGRVWGRGEEGAVHRFCSSQNGPETRATV